MHSHTHAVYGSSGGQGNYVVTQLKVEGQGGMGG